jgi:hypothetical protein
MFAGPWLRSKHGQGSRLRRRSDAARLGGDHSLLSTRLTRPSRWTSSPGNQSPSPSSGPRAEVIELRGHPIRCLAAGPDSDEKRSLPPSVPDGHQRAGPGEETKWRLNPLPPPTLSRNKKSGEATSPPCATAPATQRSPPLPRKRLAWVDDAIAFATKMGALPRRDGK